MQAAAAEAAASGEPDSVAAASAKLWPKDPKRWAEAATQHFFPADGPSPTPQQLLAAFRLAHAGVDSNVQPQDLARAAGQAAFVAVRTELGTQGRDLVRNSYVAGISPATGRLLVDHEDYVHKSKCLVSQLRSQDAKNSPGELLLSKANVLAAAKGEGRPELSHIVAALSPNVDAQNVPVVEAVLYDEELQVGAQGAHQGGARMGV
jgi:hypothetical protein